MIRRELARYLRVLADAAAPAQAPAAGAAPDHCPMGRMDCREEEGGFFIDIDGTPIFTCSRGSHALDMAPGLTLPQAKSALFALGAKLLRVDERSAPVLSAPAAQVAMDVLTSLFQGCGNHGCRVKPPKQGTNGPCRCSDRLLCARESWDAAEWTRAAQVANPKRWCWVSWGKETGRPLNVFDYYPGDGGSAVELVYMEASHPVPAPTGTDYPKNTGIIIESPGTGEGETGKQ